MWVCILLTPPPLPNVCVSFPFGGLPNTVKAAQCQRGKSCFSYGLMSVHHWRETQAALQMELHQQGKALPISPGGSCTLFQPWAVGPPIARARTLLPRLLDSPHLMDPPRSSCRWERQCNHIGCIGFVLARQEINHALNCDKSKGSKVSVSSWSGYTYNIYLQSLMTASFYGSKTANPVSNSLITMVS